MEEKQKTCGSKQGYMWIKTRIIIHH